MINNTTLFINQSLNNTITNCSMFACSNTTYMHFSNITNISSGIKFYGACIGYYPIIFISIGIITLMVSYAIIKDVIINERNKRNKKDV